MTWVAPKKIVCYGDSNTSGLLPSEQWATLPPEKQKPWPGQLQRHLGENYEVINVGLPGRTFGTPDVGNPNYCGITHLGSLLATQNPIDLFIILLGTNDTKRLYKPTVVTIAQGLEKTIDFVQNKKVRGFPLTKAPKILVICPPPTLEIPEQKSQRWTDAKISAQLHPVFQAVAKKMNCGYLNAADIIQSSPVDGIHWDAASHARLAETVAEIAKTMLS